MFINTPAIVLAIIKYNDSDAIIKTYTAETGFTTFYGKGFYKGRRARQKKALFQPNALLDLQFQFKNKGQLEYIKEATANYHYKTLNINFDKLNISTFLREILLESLKNEQPDIQLFDFIQQEFIRLDKENFNPDFHIYFLLKLTRFLGFFPDLESNGIYFDLQNACFTNHLPLTPYLNQSDSMLFKGFSGMIFAINNDANLNQKQRKKMLDILLKYYQQHITQFHRPKSIKILSQIYE